MNDMNKSNFISTLANKPKAWLLLAISALGLEFCALYFQYIMDLAPCIMCIYQRVAIFSIFFAGLFGYFTCQHIIGRLLSYTLWAVGAIWGLLIAIEHVDMQGAAFSLFFSCEIIPNFPSWAPLHEWLPFLFEATGDCGDINWQFLEYSMPQWMILVYSLYTAALAFIIGTRVINLKKL